MTEADFCEDVTKLILGILVGEGRNIVCVPEVPRTYWSNEHIDMLLLDVRNKEFLTIEYKLSNPAKLQKQVQNNQSRGLPCFGVVAAPHAHIPDQYDCNVNAIFRYTGRDIELERIAAKVLYKGNWASIFQSLGMIYYWAFKERKDNYEGGIHRGEREMFAAVYVQAIKNLHRHYGKLDFLLTHATLNSGYSVEQSKKYYRKAIE